MNNMDSDEGCALLWRVIVFSGFSWTSAEPLLLNIHRKVHRSSCFASMDRAMVYPCCFRNRMLVRQIQLTVRTGDLRSSGVKNVFCLLD